jgi:hypothetical protein
MGKIIELSSLVRQLRVVFSSQSTRCLANLLITRQQKKIIESKSAYFAIFTLITRIIYLIKSIQLQNIEYTSGMAAKKVFKAQSFSWQFYGL